MKWKTFLFFASGIIGFQSSAQATLVNLDFLVSAYKSECSPNCVYNDYVGKNFTYRVAFDTAVSSSSSSSWGDHQYVSTYFTSAELPNTPLTAEVLSKAPVQLDRLTSMSSDMRDYGPSFNGLGYQTSESINLGSFSGWVVNANTGQNVDYELNLSLMKSFPDVNVAQSFTSESFLAYMESLIGTSNFTFKEALNITSPDFHTFDYSYDYWGTATLENVSVASAPVPEPTTSLLFGLGVAGLATMRRRKKIN